MLLDGKKVASEIREICRLRVASCTERGLRPPKLAIIQAGDSPASNNYIKFKRRDCDEIGIEHQLFHYSDDWTDHYQVTRVQELIKQLNADETVDGIIVQLPLEGLDSKYYETGILSTIHATKDVDGLRPDVFAKINVPYYSPDGYYPCTPHGVLMLLDYYDYDLTAMATCIIGRSTLVTKPLAQMLINRNAEVTVVHSKCTDDQIWCEMKNAKLIISGVGIPNKWDVCSEVNISEQPILIDIGTSKDPKTGKLVGDFCGYDFLDHYNDLDLVDYTPVPGGVGPMTRAALMLHTVDAWERHLIQKGDLLCQTKNLLPRKSRLLLEKLNASCAD